MEKNEKKANLIIFDIGSTYTKGTAINVSEAIRFVGRSQAPTTVEHILVGLGNARANLENQNITFAPDTQILATSSAAGGLRMVALGYMPKVTAKAAKEVAMSAGAKVLEVLSHNDPRDYKAEVLREIKPDIILLAGGTDGGDTQSVIENAEIIKNNGGEAVVVYAGNKEAQGEVYDILSSGQKACLIVGNVMPNIHTLNVKPSREVIHTEFIKQITKANGLKELTQILSSEKVIPTPGAVLLGAELLAKGTYKEKGLESIILVDLGGATTDIHSVLADNENLSYEEAGLITTNDKQPTYRTVEGNLGMRVSATGIIQAVGPEAVLQRVGLSGAEAEKEIVDYADFLEKNPEYLPTTPQEEAFDIALAATAIEVALKRHAGYYAQGFDPVLGIVPGIPVGRDLRKGKYIVGVGGVFANSTEEKSSKILQLATKDPGISLLPEHPEVLIDKDYLLYTIGVLAEIDPEKAIIYAKNHFNIPLCGNK